MTLTAPDIAKILNIPQETIQILGPQKILIQFHFLSPLTQNPTEGSGLTNLANIIDYHSEIQINTYNRTPQELLQQFDNHCQSITVFLEKNFTARNLTFSFTRYLKTPQNQLIPF